VGRSLIGNAFRIRKLSARREWRKVTRAWPGGSKHLSFQVAPGTQSVSNSLSLLSARYHISLYSPLRSISNLLSDEYWICCVPGGRGFNDSVIPRSPAVLVEIRLHHELVSRIIMIASLYLTNIKHIFDIEFQSRTIFLHYRVILIYRYILIITLLL